MADYILQKTKEETALRRKKMYVSMPYNRVQAVEERLKRIFDDKEFIMGMLVFAYDDEDRQFLIDYIDAGDDVNIETVSVLALNLCDRRDEINADRKS